MVTRKNQNALSAKEWTDFIDAINQTHGVAATPPAYRTFVKVHERAMNPTDMQGMSWGVHTMGPMMRGRNFLSWHRQFVLRLELRLQKVHANVTIPYWDAVTDRRIPKPLDDATLLASWGVTRNWNPSLLPHKSDVTALNGFVTSARFSRPSRAPFIPVCTMLSAAIWRPPRLLPTLSFGCTTPTSIGSGLNGRRRTPGRSRRTWMRPFARRHCSA
jgi:hypothetical protein